MFTKQKSLIFCQMGRYLPKLITNKNTIIKIVLNENNYSFIALLLLIKK